MTNDVIIAGHDPDTGQGEGPREPVDKEAGAHTW